LFCEKSDKLGFGLLLSQSHINQNRCNNERGSRDNADKMNGTNKRQFLAFLSAEKSARNQGCQIFTNQKYQLAYILWSFGIIWMAVEWKMLVCIFCGHLV
jgi:hypothetical protein